METSDEDLARAAAGGDRAAFSTLVERQYDRVFRLAFRMTGAREPAEDLTQDVCAALPAKLRGYRAEARFSTWLYRVVVNAAHDQRRRRQAHARAADGWGAWEIARRAEQTDTREALDWLAQAMRQLPEELRDTLALLLDGEMTQRAAGEVLGISEGTVAWRMSEAKKRLKAMERT